MTDRHAGYLVILEEDIREDDAEALISALGLLRGVIGVRPVEADINQQIGEERAASEFRSKLLRTFWPRNGERGERE